MTLGFVLAFVFTLGWVPLFVFRTEAVGAALPAYSPAERFWVHVTHALFGIHMTAACATLTLSEDIPLWSAALSVVVYGMAIAFWFWARPLIGPLRERRLPNQPPPSLRRDGAFGLVRNPLYFSYLVAVAAPILAARQPLLLVSFALCVIAVIVRATQDERRLHAQMGAEYEAYCRQVKRLVPFIW